MQESLLIGIVCANPQTRGVLVDLYNGLCANNKGNCLAGINYLKKTSLYQFGQRVIDIVKSMKCADVLEVDWQPTHDAAIGPFLYVKALAGDDFDGEMMVEELQASLCVYMNDVLPDDCEVEGFLVYEENIL